MPGSSANRFGVLGPLVVEVGGVDRAPSAPRQRALLGLFLLHPGEPIPAERILDRLWGEEPPSGGVKTVGFHLSKLRDALEPERERGTDGTIIRTTPAGYVLDVSPDDVDASHFEALMQQARAALGDDPGKAAALARDALGLWRGPALADFTYEEFAQDEIRRLDELRMRAVETRIDADLALGRHADLIAELERLIADHPLREGLRASLMLALYRSGRQADALRTFEDTRRTLADELGIDPSRELRDLESQILAQDESLDLPTWAAPTAAAPRTDDAPNPYKGLRPFGEADAADFHGREALTGRVLERMENARFVALVGPSGSGKSSVASAGVIPRIRDTHVVARMLPGDRPLDELEIALLRAFPDAPASAAGVLRSDEGGLRRMMGLLEPDRPVLLVVDQFEELWTLSPADERTAVIDRLTTAIHDARTPLTVLVTIRSDFLGSPLSHPSLGALIEQDTVLVPPMTADEIEAAVVQPAGNVGVQVDPSLVATVVSDVAENPGALPLLQYALTEAFDQRTTVALTRADYESVGGLRGALAQRAEETFEGLHDGDRDVARQAFLRLVTPGEGTGDTRRRVSVSDLDHLGDRVPSVLGAFGAARLLTFDRDEPTNEATADIAHEAMLTEWGRLRSWIDQARDELTTHRRLRDLADEWAAQDHDPGLLLAGGRLERYATLTDSTTLRLADTERAYIEAGLQAERRRRSRSRRLRAAAIGMLSAITAVAVVFALSSASNRRLADDAARAAQEAARAAEDQARAATARAIAGDALTVLEADPALGLLLALEAAERDQGFDVIAALQQAVDAQGLLYEAATAGNPSIATYLPDVPDDRWGPGGLLASIGPGGTLQLRDFETGAVVESDDISFVITDDGITEETAVNRAADDDGTLVFGSGEFRGVYAMDWRGQLSFGTVTRAAPGVSNTGTIFEAQRLPVLPQQDAYGVAVVDDLELGTFFVGGACQVPGNPRLCVGRRAGEWVASNQTLVVEGDIEIVGVWTGRGLVTSAAIAPERDAILVGSEFGLLRFPLDGGDPTRLIASDAGFKPVESGSSGPAEVTLAGVVTLGLPGGSLVIARNSSPIVEITPEPGSRDAQGPISFVAAGPVVALATDPTGSIVAAGTDDGRVTLAGTDGIVLTTITAQPGPIEAIALDGTGGLIATTGLDGTIRVHRLAEVTGESSTTSIPESATSATSGNFAAVADESGETLTVIDTATGAVVLRSEMPAVQASFNADGSNLLVGTSTGELIVLETTRWSEVKRIRLGDLEVRGLEAGSGTDVLISIDRPAPRTGNQSVADIEAPDWTPTIVGLSIQYTLVDWEAEQVRRQLPGLGYDGNGAESFSPDRNLYAIAEQGDGIALYDATSRELSGIDLDAVPTRLALSTDGGVIVSTDASGAVTAWSTDSGNEIYGSPAHRGEAALAVERSGRWIATGGIRDGRILLWDLMSGEQLAELRGGGTGIRAVWFDPEGNRIGFLDQFGAVGFVTTDIDELIAAARAVVPEGRTLTDSECRTHLRLERCPASE